MHKKYEESELDLIELLFFIKGKYKSIILSMVTALLLSGLFLFINKDKISMTYDIKLEGYSPGMIVNCGDDFTCKAIIVERFIKKYSSEYDIKIDKINESITLTWKGALSQKDVISSDIDSLNKNMRIWYTQEFKTYKNIIDEQQDRTMSDSNLYTQIALLTNSYLSHTHHAVFIGNESKTKTYKPIVIVLLSLLIGFFSPVGFHLCVRAIDEHSSTNMKH